MSNLPPLADLPKLNREEQKRIDQLLRYGGHGLNEPALTIWRGAMDRLNRVHIMERQLSEAKREFVEYCAAAENV